MSAEATSPQPVAASAATADAVASIAPTSSVAESTGARFASRGDLKSVLMTAIFAERARKAKRRADGLPDTESSSDSDDDDDDDDDGTKQAAGNKQAASASATTAAPATSASAATTAPATSASSKNDYGMALYWNQRYTKSALRSA